MVRAIATFGALPSPARNTQHIVRAAIKGLQEIYREGLEDKEVGCAGVGSVRDLSVHHGVCLKRTCGVPGAA